MPSSTCFRTVTHCLKTHREVVKIEDQVGGTEDGYQDVQERHGPKRGSGDSLPSHDAPRDKRRGEVNQEEAADASKDGDDLSNAREDDGKEHADEEQKNVVNPHLDQGPFGFGQSEDVAGGDPPDHGDDGVDSAELDEEETAHHDHHDVAVWEVMDKVVLDAMLGERKSQVEGKSQDDIRDGDQTVAQGNVPSL